METETLDKNQTVYWKQELWIKIKILDENHYFG